MKRPHGPIPTLAELQKSTDWTWLYCERCQHSAPMKFAPLIQRLGRRRIERQATPLRALHRVRPQGRDAAASGLGR